MKRLAIVVAVAVIGGCTTSSHFVKPGVTADQQKRDQAECMQSAVGGDETKIRVFLNVDRETVVKCMTARGYRVE